MNASDRKELSEIIARNRAEAEADKWEPRRWQAAVAAMQGMLGAGPTDAETNACIPSVAVVMADALIAAYRKPKEPS